MKLFIYRFNNRK